MCLLSHIQLGVDLVQVGEKKRTSMPKSETLKAISYKVWPNPPKNGCVWNFHENEVAFGLPQARNTGLWVREISPRQNSNRKHRCL